MSRPPALGRLRRTEESRRLVGTSPQRRWLITSSRSSGQAAVAFPRYPVARQLPYPFGLGIRAPQAAAKRVLRPGAAASHRLQTTTGSSVPMQQAHPVEVPHPRQSGHEGLLRRCDRKPCLSRRARGETAVQRGPVTPPTNASEVAQRGQPPRLGVHWRAPRRRPRPSRQCR